MRPGGISGPGHPPQGKIEAPTLQQQPAGAGQDSVDAVVPVPRGALEHDHVAPIKQFGEVNGVPFLAMPLLKGESLEGRLHHEKPLAVPEVLRVGAEAAQNAGGM